MTHQFEPVKSHGTRPTNATEREELDNRLGSLDKLGFLGTVAPSEATSIKVSTFLRHSKLNGLGLLLDGEPHSWADTQLRRKIQRHTAEIFTPGMNVSYEVTEKPTKLTNTPGLPPHWHLPRVNLDGSYLHSFKVCFPSSIQARSELLEQQQTREEVDPDTMEALCSVLLPVEPGEH